MFNNFEKLPPAEHKVCKEFAQAKVLTNLVCDGFFTMCLLVVIGLMQANRSTRTLPMALKCSLLLLLATYACFDARNIYQAVMGKYLEKINDLPIVV